LFEYFKKQGANPIHAQVLSDATTRQSRGFGYVEFSKSQPGLYGDHRIDERLCGVREYNYPARRRGNGRHSSR